MQKLPHPIRRGSGHDSLKRALMHQKYGTSVLAVSRESASIIENAVRTYQVYYTVTTSWHFFFFFCTRSKNTAIQDNAKQLKTAIRLLSAHHQHSDSHRRRHRRQMTSRRPADRYNHTRAAPLTYVCIRKQKEGNNSVRNYNDRSGCSTYTKGVNDDHKNNTTKTVLIFLDRVVIY